MGGQLGRIPSILSIPDTVSVRWYVWGDNSGGSRVYLVYNPSILSIPDTVSVRYLVFRTLCL